MKTNILKMIEQAEVEWKPLGEVVDVKTGQSINKQKIENNQGIYPVINSGREPLGYINEWNTENDPIGVTTRGAGVGSITWQEGKYFRGNLNYSVTIKDSDDLDVRFLFHLLLHFQKQIHSLCTFTGIPALNASELKTLLIPVPKLELQKEIVKRLDILTELEATLEAELILRKKQYHYYRDFLLSESELAKVGFEWKSLGEVATKIYSGGTPKTDILDYWENGNIPWMSSGEVNLGTVYQTEKFITELGLQNSSAKIVPRNSVVIALAGQGKTRGKVARIRLDLTTNQSLASIVCDENIINPDYVFHFLNTQYENLRQISSGNGARGGLNLQMISSYKIPIPPLETQSKIVAILDKFDRLTSSITDGLPKEIELRRKQYEYYRELLLGFSQS